MKDLESLSTVVHALVSIPVLTDNELGYILSGHDDSLLPLHISIYQEHASRTHATSLQ